MKFSNISTDTTIIIKDYMLNEKLTFCLKISIKSNQTKSHTTTLKSAEYKVHVMKEQLFKWMSFKSHGLSFDETLFLSYQKVPKVKTVRSYSKEGDLKTIDICIENLCNGNQNPPNIPRYGLCNFPNIATKESFFMFNNKNY